MWANATGQAKPSNDARTNIYKYAAALKEHFPIAETLQKLDAECRKFVADAERVRLLSPNDMEYITWGEFLTFFFQELQLNINRQLAAIARQKAQCVAENAQGVLILTVAGASFGVFILFTMLLAILRIENNSYEILNIVHAKAQALTVQ